MRKCKVCGLEKPFKEYTSCTNYQTTTYRHICKKCVNKDMREKAQKIKEELNQLKEKEDIIKRFNNLKSADRILKLLNEGYDVSWSGEGTIIFNKAEKVVHAKHATKEVYNLVFARYCIEIENRFIKNNLMKDKNKKIEESKL
ncbi:hypothetical protein [Cetobacterium sp.]|uniref:hypothetical protein n=1 Tax=Cetobacterium sp. TaxID=2071632 RepID=UPI003F3ED255